MKARSAVPRYALPILSILGLVLASTIIPSPVIIAQETATSAQAPAATQPVSDDLPPLPLSPIEKAQKDGTALPLSLKEVTKLALQNNLDIAIQDTNEQASYAKILSANAVYDPTLSGSFSTNSSKRANTSIYAASLAPFNTSKSLSWNYQFQQPLRTGGSISANWQSGRSTTDTTNSTLNPNYNTSGTLTFTQPLWRNFRIDSNRGNLKIANLDLKTTDSSFKQKVTDTISNIQSQYWDLVSAIRDYDIKRNSVSLGQRTLRDNRKKVEVGTLAPIGILEAQADLAQRELSLMSSEENILRQENAMRQLISNDRHTDIWSKVIVPTETPDFREYKIDLETAIETALKNRPELEQIDIQLKTSDINMELTRNSRKWQVDLTASYGSSGDSGQPTGFGQMNIIESHIGGLGRAYNNLFTEGLTNWTLRVNVNIPLRNRSNDAQMAQQQISRKKTLMQRKSTEQNIQVELRNAIQKLETNRKQVDTAKLGRQLSEEQLAGEVKRNEAGLSENFRVLERQNQLASAEYTYLTNLINYKKAVITLQKSMYTLLESNDIEMAKGSSSNVPDLK